MHVCISVVSFNKQLVPIYKLPLPVYIWGIHRQGTCGACIYRKQEPAHINAVSVWFYKSTDHIQSMPALIYTGTNQSPLRDKGLIFTPSSIKSKYSKLFIFHNVLRVNVCLNCNKQITTSWSIDALTTSQ